MCNRHVTHMIADYEAARLEADEEEGGLESRDREQAAREQPGVLAALRSRLAR
ncbi:MULTISPECIES: hypothetical protein [unclassified Haladaptatus]|uniref:hypothetical protein n=1 Tax=unclassified Haladaptatus TaxID=2622732 RepID=UPI0023E830B7|nr:MULTISPECIES: hypothetical protein [unclassified Haladaptatus]